MDLPKAIHELEYGQGSVYGPEEEAALGEVLRANAPSCGPQVKKFEETFASYCGVRYGLAVKAGEQGVREEGDDNAKDDVELEHAGEPPAMLRRRDFGDVERGNDGGNADAKAPDHARDDERIDIRRQPGPDG